MADHHEVAHAWAHQTGRDRNGHSMFYDGDTIYSYGRHFPIARIVEVKGRTVVLFTTRSYSVSTAKQKSIVRGSIHRRILDVERPDSTDRTAQFDEMVTRAGELVEKSKRARSNGDEYLRQASLIIRDANDFAALFDVKRPELSLESLGAAVAGIADRIRKAAAKEARRRAKEAKERERQEAESRAAWLAGAPGRWRGTVNGKALLRVDGDNLETSQGASVPLAHAVRAFRFIKLVRQTGTGWKRNGRVIRVGTFTVDAIDPTGNVTAGCHAIAWSEVERIAKAIGVDGAAPSDEAAELSQGAA